jgi:hypothetical protein
MIVLLYKKLYIRQKYMWNKWYINATGYLNTISGKHWVHSFFCDNLNWGAYVVSKELNQDPDSLGRRHTKETGNRNTTEFSRTVNSLSWTHVNEWSSTNWGCGNATRGKTEKLNFQATEHSILLTIALPRGFLVSAVSCPVMSVSDTFVSFDLTKGWRSCYFLFLCS